MGMTVICFHNNNEENGYLSNWYPSTFTHNGITFSSMEQYMMYRKALSFGDEKVATQILATDNAAEIKALGRLVSGYDESLWNGIRQIVVYEGLFAKFTQNPDLRERLKDYQITCKQKKPLSGLVIYTKKMSLDHQQKQSRLIFRS